MVVPLIPIALSILGGTALGSYATKGGGSEMGAGFLEFGTTKKLTKTQDSFQFTSTYSPTTTSTFNYQPMETFSPNYSYNPMTIIGSRDVDITKKEAYAQALNPSWETPVNIEPTTDVSPTSTQSMGGGSSDIIDSVKQFALLGVIGFVAYKLLFGGKKK